MRGLAVTVIRLGVVIVFVTWVLPFALPQFISLFVLPGIDNDWFEEFFTITLPPILLLVVSYFMAPWFAKIAIPEPEKPSVDIDEKAVLRLSMFAIGLIFIGISLPSFAWFLGDIYNAMFGEPAMSNRQYGAMFSHRFGICTQGLFGVLLVWGSRKLSSKESE